MPANMVQHFEEMTPNATFGTKHFQTYSHNSEEIVAACEAPPMKSCLGSTAFLFLSSSHSPEAQYRALTKKNLGLKLEVRNYDHGCHSSIRSLTLRL